MSDLTVRKLLIDLETPFELRWNGGDAFTSAFMKKRALRRIAHINQKKSIHAVAITAAYEHYTSVFAAWLLNHPDFLSQAPERLQTCNNLWHEGSLFKLSTWRSAWRHLFAKQGLFTSSFAAWKQYFRPDFHPDEHDDQLSRQWLQTHLQTYQAIGQST